jgi:hypothetical protein
MKKIGILKKKEHKKEIFQVLVNKSNIKEKYEEKENSIENLLKIIDFINLLSENKFFSSESSTLFYYFLLNEIYPKFDSFEDRIRIKILRATSQIINNITVDDSRNTIENIFLMLVKYLPLPPLENEKNPELNFTYLEALLYNFYTLAIKTPGLLNRVCGIKIITGQPLDIDLEDYKEKFEIFMKRIKYSLTQTNDFINKLIQYDKNITENKSENIENEKNIIIEKKKKNQKVLLLVRNVETILQSFLKKNFNSKIHFSWLDQKHFKKKKNISDNDNKIKKQKKFKKSFKVPDSKKKKN